MRSSYIALCLLTAGAARAELLVETWTTTPAGSPDGAALGDIDGDGRLETALLLRGGTYEPDGNSPGVGTLVLLDADGALVKLDPAGTEVWSVQTGSELVGFPTFGDFDGDGFDEVAFCEVLPAGYCRAYDADRSLLFSVGPFWYPAMTNGGPVAADVNGDGYDDLVITSSAGEVRAAAGPMGSTLWDHDLWDSQQDWPFGHAAVDDIDGDGTLEVVIGGAERGGLYVLNAEDGEEQWSRNDIYETTQNYFWGSGPILVNLDGDAELEIVASMAGYPASSAVAAFDSNGDSLWHTPVSGDLFYTSPAAADTDGDGVTEVFVQTFGGILMKFAASDGALLDSEDLGDDSWSTPAFIDIDYDGAMEVISTTLSALYILDSGLDEIDRYENADSGLFPPPIVGDTDGNGKLDLVTGAWFPAQVVSVPLPYTGSFQWSAFGGSAAHVGSVAPDTPAINLGDDPAPGMIVVQEALLDLIAQASDRDLRNARNDLDLAYRYYLRGDPHLGVDRLRQTIEHLQDSGADTDLLEQWVAYNGVLVLEQYIARTAAISGPHGDIDDALALLATAEAELLSGDYLASIEAADDGSLTVRELLDFGSYGVGSHCPATLNEVYLAWECRIIDVRDQVQALLTIYPGNNALQSADSNLRTCLVWYPDLVFNSAYPGCNDAVASLESFTQEDVTALIDELTFARMRNTRLYIDDVTVWFGDVDPDAVDDAEQDYALGVADYLAGNYEQAMVHFDDAYDDAYPCSGDSFGGNAEGLSGGGCSL